MGAIFKFPGYIVWLVGGIWGFFVSLSIVQDWLGDFLGFLLGVFLLPVLLTVAPLIEGFSNSNWEPAMVVYGSGIVGLILIGIGSAIDGDL